MEIKFHKQWLIIVMIIAVFIFIVALTSLYTQRVITCGEAQTCTIPIPFLIPIVASAGLFIGTLIYYLMAGKVLKKDVNLEKCSEVIGNLFSKEEKAVLKILTKHKQISQAKITSLAGMPRLKIFRIIEKLREKGLIEKQEEGKARIIHIREEAKWLFENLK